MRAAMRSLVWSSNRTPASVPPVTDCRRKPAAYHQSPSSSDTRRGAGSAKARSMRFSHRSGGSMTWESVEMRVTRSRYPADPQGPTGKGDVAHALVDGTAVVRGDEHRRQVR